MSHSQKIYAMLALACCFLVTTAEVCVQTDGTPTQVNGQFVCAHGQDLTHTATWGGNTFTFDYKEHYTLFTPSSHYCDDGLGVQPCSGLGSESYCNATTGLAETCPEGYSCSGGAKTQSCFLREGEACFPETFQLSSGGNYYGTVTNIRTFTRTTLKLVREHTRQVLDSRRETMVGFHIQNPANGMYIKHKSAFSGLRSPVEWTSNRQEAAVLRIVRSSAPSGWRFQPCADTLEHNNVRYCIPRTRFFLKAQPWGTSGRGFQLTYLKLNWGSCYNCTTERDTWLSFDAEPVNP